MGKATATETTRRLPKAPRFSVDVTKELIEQGKTRDSSHCMIAEAVKAPVPTAKKITVDIQTIRFSDVSRRLRFIYLTPRKGQVSLIAFDQGQTPRPFKFQLRGGHVIRMAGAGSSSRKHRRSSAQNASLSKARLVARDSAHPSEITLVGGSPPPTTAFAKRRAFGLKGLGRAEVEFNE